MQKFLLLSLALAFAKTSAQTTSAVTVPKEFTDHRMNETGMRETLISALKKKNITILADDSFSWPDEYTENPCSVFTAQMRDTSSMFRNKATVDLVDCKKKTVASAEGKSFIKEITPGMKEAIVEATKELSLPAPSTLELRVQPKKAQAKTQPTLSAVPEKTEISAPTNTNKAEIYTNDAVSLNRITVSAKQFILASANSAAPYAVFNASKKKDLYHVRMQDGSTGLAYFENGDLFIELQSNDGSIREERLKGK